MLTDVQKEEFLWLFKKYQQQTASPEEMAFLEAYYRYFDFEEKQSLKLTEEDLQQLEDRIYSKIESIINKNEWPVTKRKVFTRWQKIAAAIAFIGFAATSFYIIRTSSVHPIHKEDQAIASKTGKDFLPGGNKAVLTLADGSSIILDSTKNGRIASQGNSNIMKSDSGMLAYQLVSRSANTGLPEQPQYNTITTPNGGLYQILLSDGSRVWLNAASSLRFPASFSGSDRQVELTGEAYFEISKQTRTGTSSPERIPFIVHTGAGDIQVLGTHFNVNAYANEQTVRTTLLEGSVQFSNRQSSVLLKPGMQSKADPGGKLELARDVNIDDVMAWKNGVFRFRSADIETIMRQMARWYDVEVEYAGKVDEKFYVETPRSTNASELFKILETTRAVHFQIKGKKVIVLP